MVACASDVGRWHGAATVVMKARGVVMRLVGVMMVMSGHANAGTVVPDDVDNPFRSLAQRVKVP